MEYYYIKGYAFKYTPNNTDRGLEEISFHLLTF